jgi:hypothetical protein
LVFVIVNKIPEINNLREEGFILTHNFRGCWLEQGRNIIAVGTCGRGGCSFHGHRKQKQAGRC